MGVAGEPQGPSSGAEESGGPQLQGLRSTSQLCSFLAVRLWTSGFDSVPPSLLPDSGHSKCSASKRHDLLDPVSNTTPLAQPPCCPWGTRQEARDPSSHSLASLVQGVHSLVCSSNSSPWPGQ